MTRVFVSFLSGVLFGAGLALSQMTNPLKVINFLDILGNWDPSLIFVMIGALTVTMLSFRLILKRQKPLLDSKFHLSNKSAIDNNLIIGAAVFGIGWGLSGYCPGPVIAGLGLGSSDAVVMIIFIYLGFGAHRLLKL